MLSRFTALAAAVVLLTACGASEDDKVVMKDPSNGAERTYKEVRDMFADGTINLDGKTCATFTAHGAENEGIEFPAGQAEFVKACEEGLKAHSKS
jgi:major membrane immunogen (membrane-anchored lipoprotein)